MMSMSRALTTGSVASAYVFARHTSAERSAAAAASAAAGAESYSGGGLALARTLACAGAQLPADREGKGEPDSELEALRKENADLTAMCEELLSKLEGLQPGMLGSEAEQQQHE